MTDFALPRLPAGVEATAYFVVREALTNVVKHAHADRAEVSTNRRVRRQVARRPPSVASDDVEVGAGRVRDVPTLSDVTVGEPTTLTGGNQHEVMRPRQEFVCKRLA